MRRSHKLAVALTAAATLTFTMAACSGSGGGDAGGKKVVTWSTWGTPDELKAFEAFNAQFMEKHSDIKVVFQPVPSYDEYHSKLNTQLTSGTAPDVFYLGDDKVTAVAVNNVLEPINSYIEAAGSAITLDQFTPEIYRVATIDDKIYGLPNDVNPDALWYDKEALKTAGITEDPAELAKSGEWTTDKFLEMTGKLKAADLHGAVYWNYWATHASWMVTQGGEVYNEDGDYVANTDATSVAAMDVMAQKFQNGEFVVADTMPKGNDADTGLVTHKIGFLVQGRYTISTIEGAGLDVNGYDVVRWPTPDGAEGSSAVAASFLAINAKSKNKDAAYTFFSEFLSKDGQETRLADNGNALPSITGLDHLVTDSGKPANAQALIDMRDNGFSNFPAEAAVPNLSNQISNDFMLKLYQGKATTQETLDGVAALVKEKTSK